MSNKTENGAKFKILTLIAEYSHHLLAVHEDSGTREVNVITVVKEAIACSRELWRNRSNNRPEFIAIKVQERLTGEQIQNLYITPGSPSKTRHIGRFNAMLRNECLERKLFGSRLEARMILEKYRKEHKAEQPHSALGYGTLDEYVLEGKSRSDGGCPPTPCASRPGRRSRG